MTTISFNYNRKTLLKREGSIIPRINDDVELVDPKYKSKTDSGTRKYRVSAVTHKPADSRVVIDVDYVGFPDF